MNGEIELQIDETFTYINILTGEVITLSREEMRAAEDEGHFAMFRRKAGDRGDILSIEQNTPGRRLQMTDHELRILLTTIRRHAIILLLRSSPRSVRGVEVDPKDEQALLFQSN